jgi:hypothetical protein
VWSGFQGKRFLRAKLNVTCDPALKTTMTSLTAATHRGECSFVAAAHRGEHG